MGEDGRTGAAAGGRASDLWRRILRHPVLTVALVGVVVVLHHLWIIHRDRHLGTFDLDESGYLAQAMRMQRAMAAGGVGRLGSVQPTETGPLVPLLSALALVARPRSAIAALAVQPVLAAVAAVAVAGTTRRIAGARAALVAGLVALGLPALVLAARTYQPSVGAAAALALAVWALLASERGTRLGPMIGFGAAVGALLVTRTMTLAFLPGLAVAVGLQLRRDRRAVAGLLAAVAAAALVALPWWLPHGGTAWAYLDANGYGDPAAQYGPGSAAVRVGQRLAGIVLGVRLLLLVPAVAVWAGAVRAWRRRGSTRWRASATVRDLATIWAVLVLGYLALLTTANSGVGFDVPLLALGVAGTASLAVVLPPPRRRTAARFAAVAAAVNLVAIGHVVLVGDHGVHRDGRLVVGPDHLAFAGRDVAAEELAVADPRFALGRPAAERSAAAAAWWKATVEVVWALDRIEAETPGGAIRTATGSSPLLSANSILLAEEIASQGERQLTELDAGDPSDAFLRFTQPVREGRHNVLIVIQAVRVDDVVRARLAAQLARVRREGWEVHDRVPLPDGGRVSLLVFPR